MSDKPTEQELKTEQDIANYYGLKPGDDGYPNAPDAGATENVTQPQGQAQPQLGEAPAQEGPPAGGQPQNIEGQGGTAPANAGQEAGQPVVDPQAGDPGGALTPEQENIMLRQQLAEAEAQRSLAGLMDVPAPQAYPQPAQPYTAQPTQYAPPFQQQQQQAQAPQQPEPIPDFFGEDAYGDLAAMNKGMQKAVEFTLQQADQRSVARAAEIVGPMVERNKKIRLLSQFEISTADLKDQQQLLFQVGQQIRSQNPMMDDATFLTTLEREARQRLNRPKQVPGQQLAQVRQAQPAPRVAVAPAPGARRSIPKAEELTPVQKENLAFEMRNQDRNRI